MIGRNGVRTSTRARNSLSAVELSRSEDALKNDRDAQKFIQCGQSLAGMFESLACQDDLHVVNPLNWHQTGNRAPYLPAVRPRATSLATDTPTTSTPARIFSLDSIANYVEPGTGVIGGHLYASPFFLHDRYIYSYVMKSCISEAVGLVNKEPVNFVSADR